MFYYVRIKLHRTHIVMDTFPLLQTKHECLWVAEVPDLQFRFLLMLGFQSFQSTDPDTFVTFHGIKVQCLSFDKDLDDRRVSCSTGRPSDCSSQQMEHIVTPTMSLYQYGHISLAK